MSVYVLNKTEYQSIFNMIMRLNNERNLLPSHERYDCEQLAKSNKEWNVEMLTTEKIKALVDRMYFANQMAYFYQYREDEFKFDFSLFEELKFNIMNYNLKKGLKALKSCNYNMITNAGRSFFSKEDNDWLSLIELRALNDLSGVYR